MHIQSEAPTANMVSAYSEQAVCINNQQYSNNLLVSNNALQSDWPVKHINEMNEDCYAALEQSIPEVILIGHNGSNQLPPLPLLEYFSQKGIGIEAMSIGAACRTFNLLLSENRRVCLAILF